MLKGTDMKLYIITIEDVYDGDSTHHQPIIKKSIEEARQTMQDLYNENKSYYDGDGFVIDDFVPGSDCFEMYEDGYYSQNHYSAVIDEVEI
jgi:hypothetical protein